MVLAIFLASSNSFDLIFGTVEKTGGKIQRKIGDVKKVFGQ